MILESRLTLDPSTTYPPAYQVGPEWADTEHADLAGWLSDAADNCPGIELCPDEERPTVYGGDGCLIYRWPALEDASSPHALTAWAERTATSGGWNYTAVRVT